MVEQKLLDTGATKLRTRFTYPDGDLIDVYLWKGRMTDLGETTRWLRYQGIPTFFIPTIPNVDLVNGELHLRTRSDDNLQEDAISLAVACKLLTTEMLMDWRTNNDSATGR